MTSRTEVISFDDAPPIGGQGRYVLALERELPGVGFEVGVLSPKRTPYGPIKVPRRTRRAPLDYSLWLRRHVDDLGSKVRPDLWHAQGGPGGVLMLRRPPGAPLVYTAHHTYRTAHGRGLNVMAIGSFEARGYRMASRVIAVSHSTADSLMGDSGIPREKIVVIPPGVDTGWFTPPPAPGAGRQSILFVGRLVPDKGVQHFVALFRELRRSMPDLVAEVIGEGVLRPIAEGVAATLDGRLRVPGRVSDRDLLEAYRRARLLIVPSRYEGLGIVALEALACGTPVVALEVPGLRDLRGGGVVLVSPEDPRALGRAVRELLANPARLRELSLEARQRAEDDFSWRVLAPRIADVYRSALDSSSSQSA